MKVDTCNSLQDILVELCYQKIDVWFVLGLLSRCSVYITPKKNWFTPWKSLVYFVVKTKTFDRSGLMGPLASDFTGEKFRYLSYPS